MLQPFNLVDSSVYTTEYTFWIENVHHLDNRKDTRYTWFMVMRKRIKTDYDNIGGDGDW